MSDALDPMIAKLRALRSFGEETAKTAAPLVLEAVRADVADGIDPTTGEAWKPKKGGGEPLRNASKALAVSTSGETVTVTLRGHEVFHHYGSADGGKRLPKRPILPDAGAGVPKKVDEAARKAAAETFRRTTGAR